MVATELIIAFGTFVHFLLARKWKLSFKILFAEGLVILFAGIILFLATGRLFLAYLPGDPLSSFSYLSLGSSILLTSLVSFLAAKFFFKPTPFIYILPWALTGIYRHLHELLWQFHYWITLNVLRGGFSDYIPIIAGETERIVPIIPDLYVVGAFTHAHALAIVLYATLSLLIILQLKK